MEEMQIIIEALEKGIRNGIYTKMDIYAIQKSVAVVSEKVQSLEPVKEKQDAQN